MHMHAFINTYKIALQKQTLKLAYLAYDYKTKPSIIKYRILPVNAALTMRILIHLQVELLTCISVSVTTKSAP